MEHSSVTSPRSILNRSTEVEVESEGSNAQLPFELESSNHYARSDFQYPPMNVLDILRECVRVLRYNLSAFMLIAALLICPVSAVLLTKVLVNRSIAKTMTIRVLLLSKSIGLPLIPLVKKSCQGLAEMVLSAVVCFPLYITFLLLSKAGIVHSVDCAYSRKQFDVTSFYLVLMKIRRPLVVTYLWACAVIVGCLTLFLVLLAAGCDALSLLGFTSNAIVYPAMAAGLVFSIVYAIVVMICNVAVVVSVLEEGSGPRALLRSGVLIKEHFKVVLLLYLWSNISMAFVVGLFDHRVNTLSYGDGSSRIWEGPLLVIMYSFVVLMDAIMSSVFYFSSRSSSTQALGGKSDPALETMIVTSGSVDSQ